MRNSRFRFMTGGLAAFAVSIAGCTSRPVSQITGADISGKVSYKGQPVTGGSVRLVDPADPNKSMTGNITGDGSYRVVNAPVGELVAVVETETAKADPRVFIAMAKAKGANVDESKLQGPPLKYVKIPRKYNDPAASPLRVKIEKGPNVQDLNLE